ncbi:hypothetical protein G7074_25865 [Pedobacter sp. HDW13]|uniref:hypothetical protein n=1 Tax=Pedobacter sp. HDW13 TaxID=2714940 RepID=UPI00140E7CCA|nr:hypothetical protein [Pedobacter sp. HDW13]QIL42386.1 hypothetical protein G7074_25865 [Pedobacter sp. HDW13]
MTFSDFLIKYIFRQPGEEAVFLGSQKQYRSMVAIVETTSFWEKLSWADKLIAIFKFNWRVTDQQLEEKAAEVFQEIFGKQADYGEQLFNLMQWHHSRLWNLKEITEIDKEKTSGLDSLSIITRNLIRKVETGHLNLKIADRAPQMCTMLHGMVIKIPVISIQYCLDIDSLFAFNSIRKSKHPLAESIVSYLYEIQFIQYKIVDSLLSFLKLTQQIKDGKGNSSLTHKEFSAIKDADLVFTYLKSTVEKAVILLGAIYEIKDLENKKTHKSKLDALSKGIPVNIQNIGYFLFVWEFIKSENLDELNKYRTGLLHKKGISDLQPHMYTDKTADRLPLIKVYNVLHEQHAKNTAVLIGVLALLTDKLVILDPPEIAPWDIP